MKIPDETKIQSVDLRIKDLDASLYLYNELLGFKIIEKTKDQALLSANGNLPYMIKLIEDKNALPVIKNTPGLYHVAFRFKNRKELGRVFMRLFKNNTKFQAFSDHLVSEAIYLLDPDGIGIELYADKPKDEWIWEYGQLVMDTLPLDISLITAELDDPEVWNGIDAETVIGHVHLKVSDLLKSEIFCNRILGFNVTLTTYPGALFFSAGGYHHHMATNIWFSKNNRITDDIRLGLIEITFKIPDEEYVKMISVKAEEDGLLLEKFNENNKSIVLKDFDGNIMEILI